MMRATMLFLFTLMPMAWCFAPYTHHSVSRQLNVASPKRAKSNPFFRLSSDPKGRVGLDADTSHYTPHTPSLSSRKKSNNISGLSKSIDLCKKVVAGVFASLFVLTNLASPLLPGGGMAVAGESRLIGEIQGSGIFFKDTLHVESFDDPKVRGVTLYITNFQRPLTERLQKDFFSDPSFASVGCARTGPIQIADNVVTGSGGEEVFEESRSLLFKTLRVQRIYDKEKNTVVYVSFNTRFDKNNDANKSRFKSSTCAVSLD